MGVDKEVPFSWFGKTLRKFIPIYAELTVIAVVLKLIGIVEPFIFQVIIDRILPFQREATLVVVIAIFVLVSVFQLIFSTLSSILGALTSNRVTRDFGGRVFEHLFALPLGYFRKWSVGETIARLGETDVIHSFIVGTSMGVLLDFLFVFIYLFILYALSPQLTLIVMLALPIQAAIYFGFGPFMRGRLQAQFAAGAKHQTQIVENISGMASIKSLTAEKPIVGRVKATLLNSLKANFRVRMLGLINGQCIFFFDRIITIMLVYFGANLVFTAKMTLGQLVAFNLISGKVSGPVSNFAQLWQGWQQIRVARQRLGDIITTKPEPFGTMPKLPETVKPHLVFHDVTFFYNESRLVLNRFSFVAKPYSLSLVTGPSGSGKSTFGRLAAGIERPSSGRVTLDEYHIGKCDPHSVRRQVIYVPQEPYLFSGTLRENLTLALTSPVSDHIIYATLEIAAAGKMVRNFPLALDTPVGERGSALSGGERQRIAIARALLLKPKVLIIDEPTGAIDKSAQKVMIQGIKTLLRTSTVIVITHRPEIFGHVNQIIDFGKLQ